MNKPLVSILITIYNHQNFVRDSINSIIKQNYNKWDKHRHFPFIVYYLAAFNAASKNIKCIVDLKFTVGKGNYPNIFAVLEF